MGTAQLQHQHLFYIERGMRKRVVLNNPTSAILKLRVKFCKYVRKIRQISAKQLCIDQAC
jgi:hypothetical protein